MKKTILTLTSIVIIVIMMLSVILAYNLDLNIKIRRKLDQFLNPVTITKVEPAFYTLFEDSYIKDENSNQLVSLFKEKGVAYLNVKNLNLDQTTAHMDSVHGVLTIVNGDVHLWIELNGDVLINGEKSEKRVEIIEIGEDDYVSLNDLNAIDEGAQIGFYLKEGASNNIVILNKYLSYAETSVRDELWLFETPEALAKYEESQFNINYLFDLKNLFSKTEVVQVLKNGKLIVYDEAEKTFVIDEENVVGYLSRIEATKSEPEKRNQIQNKNSEYEDGLVITWEAVYSYNPDVTTLPQMAGLDVISPTWYELSNAKGEIHSKVSQEYIQWAEESSLEVWPLVSNAFDIDMTHDFLEDATARQKFIATMMNEAAQYGYEGINIDFENVYLEDRDRLTHFVNEFGVYARKMNLTLSMDVTVMGGSDNWSKCYDHEKLGKIVDFLIIMAYDEFWASSPISGPVASYDWVLKHMTQLTDVVESQKLIMGLPFYTRVWREYPSETEADTYITKSTAIGMEAQNQLIEKYELSLVWDDTDKLYYATFFEEDAQVKLWIENGTTIKEKLKIVDDLDLKGVAGWRRGFETPDIWQVLSELN